MIDIPVVILCGGYGTRMKEETEYRPKPMVLVGDKPLLLHIMNIYSYYGFKRFILPLGYKGWMIKEYFLNYDNYYNNIQINFHGTGRSNVNMLSSNNALDFKIDFIETGVDTQTAARLKMIEPLIKDKFLMTYGDGLCDVNITELLKFHNSHGKAVTVTGVDEPARFGDIYHDNGRVIQFKEKIAGGGKIINGGFYVMEKRFFDFVDKNTNYKLELEPFKKIIEAEELMVYKHNGRWMCADVLREVDQLNEMYDKGDAFWIK